MSHFIVEGGHKLKGDIKVKGNKNAVLAQMAACVLTEDECTLTNVPLISDVDAMARLLEDLGAIVKGVGTDTLKISCKNIKKHELDGELVSKLRASILFFGPLLARMGKAQMRHPGGCIIGRRPIGVHFDALYMLGAEVVTTKEDYVGKASHLEGADIFLSEASVTATENTIMAAVLAEGETIIRHAACEPHVADLCEFLVKMGAVIDGIGSNLLRITGVKKLSGAIHAVRVDHIEVGTFAIVTAVTGGEVRIKGVEIDDLGSILSVLDRFGVEYDLDDKDLKVLPSKLKSAGKVTTGIWPAFPTDLMSPLIVLATQSNGVTLLHDWMYESRMFFVDKLMSMGAAVTIADPHRVVVYGPEELRAKKMDTPDLRAGMALLIAALCATGESHIDQIEFIDRGYEQIDKRLASLGAKIKRVD